MYICVCEAVTEKEISLHIINGADTVREVSRKTCAGTNCGKCVNKIRQQIDKYTYNENFGIPIQLTN